MTVFPPTSLPTERALDRGECSFGGNTPLLRMPNQEALNAHSNGIDARIFGQQALGQSNTTRTTKATIPTHRAKKANMTRPLRKPRERFTV